MKASDLMTPSPCCASTEDPAREVARMMRDFDCGAIPVVDEKNSVVGIITDRDLAIRVLAEGKDRDTPAKELMTATPCCAATDDDLKFIEKLMSDNKVRRIPIVDADWRPLGIISQADLARAAERQSVTEREVALVVEAISKPEAYQKMRPRDEGSTEQQF